ncbi:MAG: BrnT family toxin [Candidatus Desantisbacteria bacterium]
MKLNFEWNEEKAKANLKKHKVSFDEATRQPYWSENIMKKVVTKIVQMEDNDMRAEYDFTGGVHGKHYNAMQ